MNALLLILHLIPISTPPSIDHNSALITSHIWWLHLIVLAVCVPINQSTAFTGILLRQKRGDSMLPGKPCSTLASRFRRRTWSSLVRRVAKEWCSRFRSRGLVWSIRIWVLNRETNRVLNKTEQGDKKDLTGNSRGSEQCLTLELRVINYFSRWRLELGSRTRYQGEHWK